MNYDHYRCNNFKDKMYLSSDLIYSEAILS